MTGFLKKLLRDARGVTIVEFAIAAPVAIVMLVGAVQIGSLLPEGRKDH